ncbi:MAG TPA: hypothetical protein VFQ53_29690 [Kofleriaceae bacterium]|nr:hypothetical protein [Kofleriaceae bacterium]
MIFVGALLFAWIVWAGLLWLSIRLIDRTNPYNRFAIALVWGAFNVAAALVLQHVMWFGLFLAVAYLVLFVRVLTRHYELGILATIGVIALMQAIPYVVMPKLLDWVDDSELRAYVVLLGLPGGILATWLVGRRHAIAADEDRRVPRAKVVRRRETEPAPVIAPELPAPQIASVAPVAPIAPPIRPSVVPVASKAPERVAPASDADGPRFLR